MYKKFNIENERCILDLSKAENNSIIKDWVNLLPCNMQVSLLNIIRNYDNECNLNKVINILRDLIIDTKNYISDDRITTKYLKSKNIIVTELIEHLKLCIINKRSTNYLDVVMDTITIVFEYHPDEYVKQYWYEVATLYNIEMESMIGDLNRNK